MKEHTPSPIPNNNNILIKPLHQNLFSFCFNKTLSTAVLESEFTLYLV